MYKKTNGTENFHEMHNSQLHYILGSPTFFNSQY